MSEVKAREIKVELCAIPSVISDFGGGKTGDWRYVRPVINESKCDACGICSDFCPEGIIVKTAEAKFATDYDYCKGCGICAHECPLDAIGMVEET